MNKRNGVFVGGYMSVELKDLIVQRAKNNHRTVSDEIESLLIAGCGIFGLNSKRLYKKPNKAKL